MIIDLTLRVKAVRAGDQTKSALYRLLEVMVLV
jgi:hypothetical protein